MSFVEKIDRFFRPVAPPERLATMRIFAGAFAFVYMLVRFTSIVGIARSTHTFVPVGVVSILSHPLDPRVVIALWGLTAALAVPFALGLYYRFVGPLFAILLLWTMSYRSSFGFIFHTENVLVLHALVLAVTDAAAVWSLDARRQARVRPEPSADFGWPIKLMSILATLTYFIAGVTKLRTSGSQWALGEVLRNQVAFDNLRKAVVDASYSPFGAFAVRIGWIWKPLAIFTLFLELGAPLAVISRRGGQIWAICMWGFHIGVLALMWILFPYAVLGFGFATFFEPEKILIAIRNWSVRRRK